MAEMIKKGLLASTFKIAASSALGAGGVWAALMTATKIYDTISIRKNFSAYPSPPGVPLTTGEAALAKGIFGEEIDTSRIKKYFAREHPIADSEVLGKKVIKFYTSGNHSADYSQSEDVLLFKTFIHEMTHIWQNRHRLRSLIQSVTRGKLDYEYQLSAKSRFKDFGLEQQAAIIEDYAERFLYQANAGIKSPDHAKGKIQEADTLLLKVVEDRFPEAHKTRVALEAQRNVVPHIYAPQLPR